MVLGLGFGVMDAMVCAVTHTMRFRTFPDDFLLAFDQNLTIFIADLSFKYIHCIAYPV